MDDCFEVAISEDSNEDNRSIGEAEETALYSLIHHSEDTYETGMLDLSENYINRRNKAFRLDSVKKITHFTNPVNDTAPVSVDNSDLDYMSFNGNFASTSGYRPGKARNKRGHWMRDPWGYERNDRPWGVQNRVRNLYSNNRNLVPVQVENNQITFKRPKNTIEQTKVHDYNTFRNPVHNLNDILHQNNNSYQSNANNVIKEKLAGTVVNETLNKCASGSALKNASRSTSNESSNVHPLDKISSKLPKASLSKDISHEVLIISDSDEGNHASDESIVEVSVPPKPEPPVVALDSSDESDSFVVSTSLPIVNVSTSEASERQSNNEKSVHIASTICDTSHNTASGSSKKSKKNKKKKREKYSKSIECIRWTTGMIKFYNHSWGGETYDHMKLQQEMTNNPMKWKILDIDKMGPLRNFGPLARVRCGNCHQFGHMGKHCPDPKKIICCCMCGRQGHRESQCPNKMCFKCGRAAPAYNDGCPSCWQIDHPRSCSACGAQDHYNWLCPDVWRKFHSTITMEEVSSNELQAPLYKIDRELSCCYCAGRGHTAATCPYLSKQRGSRSSSNSFNIFASMNNVTSNKRKKKRNSYFDGKNKQEFNRKRRKTN